MKRKIKKKQFKLRQVVRVGKHNRQRRWIAKLGIKLGGFISLGWIRTKKKNG